eukprot:388540-Rhodomonas_salina.3
MRTNPEIYARFSGAGTPGRSCGEASPERSRPVSQGEELTCTRNRERENWGTVSQSACGTAARESCFAQVNVQRYKVLDLWT